MANVSIMCITWNQELADMDKDSIDPLFKVIQKKKPDLIVIGLQEAVKSATKSKKELIPHLHFVGKKLANMSEDATTEYSHIGELSFGGVTKGIQVVTAIGGNYAQQSIEVLKKSTAVNISLGEINSYKHSTFSEKGFLFATVNVGQKRLGFCTCHLAADDDTKRTKMANQVLKSIEEWTKSKKINVSKKLHGFWFMGDLNFRLKRPSKYTKAITNKKVPVDESSEVVQELINRGTRLSLRAEDSFLGNTTGVTKGTRTFDTGPQSLSPLKLWWVPFHDDSFPTYKRTKSKKDQGFTAWKNLLADQNYTTNGSIYDNQNMEHLIAISQYLDENGQLIMKRDGFYDFGWLDRIGFTLGNADLPKITESSTIKIEDGTMPYLYTPMDVKGGDHVPVYSLFYIDNI